MAAAPSQIDERRVAIETVGPQVELLHERQMTHSHLEISGVSGQLAGFDKKRNGHKYRVTHLIVERHRLLHLAGLGESKTGCLSHQFDVTRISGTLGQLREYKMAGQRLAVASLKRIFRPVGIRRGKPLALGTEAETHLDHHRHSGP